MKVERVRVVQKILGARRRRCRRRRRGGAGRGEGGYRRPREEAAPFLGRAVGDTAILDTARMKDRLEVVSIDYIVE